MMSRTLKAGLVELGIGGYIMVRKNKDGPGCRPARNGDLLETKCFDYRSLLIVSDSPSLL